MHECGFDQEVVGLCLIKKTFNIKNSELVTTEKSIQLEVCRVTLSPLLPRTLCPTPKLEIALS